MADLARAVSQVVVPFTAFVQHRSIGTVMKPVRKLDTCMCVVRADLRVLHQEHFCKEFDLKMKRKPILQWQ